MAVAVALCISIASGARAEEPVVLKLPTWIGGIAFSPDGKLLATGSADHKARLWNATTGKEVAAFSGHDDYVVAVAFSPDGRTLATGSYDHTARLWDVASGQTRHTLSGHRGVVMSVAFSPDGETLATASLDGKVCLWNAVSGKLLTTLTGHKSWVNAVTFSPDGKLLATGSSDGTVKLWPLRSRSGDETTLEATPAEVRSLAFSPDGKRLAAGMRYGAIKVWEAEGWKETLAFTGHEEDVWSLAFTLDSRVLVTGNGAWNQPGQVKLWEAATGKPLATLPQSGEVLALAIAPDGKRLAAACRDGRVQISPFKVD